VTVTVSANTDVHLGKYGWVRRAVARSIHNRWAKTALFAVCLLPSVSSIWNAHRDGLNVSLLERATRNTGDWTFNFLILTLAISPVRQLLSLPDLIRFRRMLGLFTFFYGCLHLTAWEIFKSNHGPEISTFNILGLRIAVAGFAVMIPLAITSTDGWIRRLGGKRWRMLHVLVYVSAVAVAAHFCMLPNPGLWKPLTYCAIVALLLYFRITRTVRRTRLLQRRESQIGSTDNGKTYRAG
jgi:sulfoxide reductase heme-binding subunit YedZ